MSDGGGLPFKGIRNGRTGEDKAAIDRNWDNIDWSDGKAKEEKIYAGPFIVEEHEQSK